MTESRCRQISLVLGGLCIFLGRGATSLSAQATRLATAATPMIFEQNKGQLPTQYAFLSRGKGAEILYLQDGMDIVVPQSGLMTSRLRLRWTNVKGAQVAGENLQPGHSNYFLGSDESRWIRGVPQFERIRYEGIYPGIELLFYGNTEQLEHDFIVRPGGTPSQIAFQLDRKFHITSAGDLEVDAGGTTLRISKPLAYQEFGGERRQVGARFVLARSGDVKIRVGAYDHGRDLVIDPILSFSTYLAGTADDQIKGVTTDATGNVYVTGYTTSSDFPLVSPEQSTFSGQEAFVSKLDPTGHSLLFSTFIGGSNGAQGSSIVIDNNGNVLVGGVSGSSDFPHAG